MARHEVRAIVAFSPENVAYTIGCMVPSHPTNRHRRTISILTADERSVLIVVSVEAELARQQSRIKDVRSYDQFTDNPMDVLASVLRELGVAAGPLAIEMDYLPVQDYLALWERLPAPPLVPCREMYQRARIVKTSEEVACLRKLAEISDQAEQVVWRQMREGMTEKALAALITNAVLEAGGDGVRTLIGAGERSGIVNPRPTERALRRGDVIRVEILGSLDNYQSNVTRTGVLGPPTEEQRRIWAILMEARELALEKLRPGTPVQDLWTAYAGHCRKNEIEPTLSFLGHGIGLTGHEEPYLTANKPLPLELGFVLTLEPFYMLPGRMGFHVEDMFLITPAGYETFTAVTTNETLIEVP
jgi:Xaa-Pro aminopeptidase